MTMIKIREYKESDKQAIIKLVEELQDFLIKIDPLKRLRRLPEYGVQYINRLLIKVSDSGGIIYLSEIDGNICGFIAGIIEMQKSVDLLECIPSLSGRILELIVSEKFRRQNIGTALMNKMENYLKNRGCDIVRVEVFQPNAQARNFYENIGYHDRVIDMIKKY